MTSATEKARDLGIPIRNSTDYRCPCPACSPNRKKKKDPCLHVTIRSGEVRYCCHHCHQFEGILTDDESNAGWKTYKRQGAKPGRGLPMARGW